jgi:hypothetical protein
LATVVLWLLAGPVADQWHHAGDTIGKGVVGVFHVRQRDDSLRSDAFDESVVMMRRFVRQRRPETWVALEKEGVNRPASRPEVEDSRQLFSALQSHRSDDSVRGVIHA